MIKAKLAPQVARLAAERVPFVVATVVRARRPTSVRPGDTAIVLADGTIDGFVGGQCAESSVRLYSLRALETGEPMLLRLIPGDGSADEHADGIDGVMVERNPCLSGGTLEIFLEPQLPAPRMVIVGGSPIAEALEQLATAAGYAVDPMLGPELGDLQDVAAVLVASHGAYEEEVLTAALSAGVPYVALVASQARGAAVRKALNLAPELSPQLHTPAGVDIGAETPAEIAISILAELVVVQHADPVPDRPGDDPGGESAGTGAGADSGDEESRPHPSGNGAGLQAPARRLPDPADAPVAVRADGRVLEPSDEPDSESADARSPQTPDGHVTDPAGAQLPGWSPPVPAEPPPSPAPGVAIDPVCGMQVAISERTLHLHVSGARVYFCGTGCRVAYAARHAPDAARR